ncbi:MAG: nickel pincer cofactor biosynthesis protein LarC [Chloroflexota bacterium]|nr:nickel pincer cofactor biosynthesis protein LarC [Chloroflexota bacterium]
MAHPVFFDCFSGASGDMLLGALLDAGADLGGLRAGLAGLALPGWRLEAAPAEQHGLHGTRATVVLDADDQPHRGLAEVLRVVRSAGLPDAVVERVCQVFERLAEVEASIHHTSPEAVQFHEVGAVDAIVDISAVVLALHLLDADWSALTCSGLPTGSGWVRAAHGVLPVPAPATLELLRRSTMPVRQPPRDGETGELTTPTGAALVTVLTRSGQAPSTPVERVGYGFGARQPAWPNALRVWLGLGSRPGRDQVAQIETNLDDATPEQLGYAMERLFEAGALDVAFSPLQMKKNRPGVLVRVLARPADSHHLAMMLLEHTSALGVRLAVLDRVVADRAERLVSTPWGSVRVKLKQLPDRELVAPEYEDCARLARQASVPIADVYAAAYAAAR